MHFFFCLDYSLLENFDEIGWVVFALASSPLNDGNSNNRHTDKHIYTAFLAQGILNGIFLLRTQHRFLDERANRVLSSYLGIAKQSFRLLVCVFDRGSDWTLGSIVNKFCTLVLRRKLLVEFFNKPNRFNNFKIAVIFNT